MLEFLPQKVKDGLSFVNMKKVYEIRLRVDKPVVINYSGEYCLLGMLGIVRSVDKAIFCENLDIEQAIYEAGEYSVYAKEEQIKQGFLTANGGVRIGLAGEYVFDKGQVLAIRDFTSLCIRIPHEIYGAGEKIYQSCMSDKIHNTLIMSPPGLGKTTILRDLARIISEKTLKNVLICDERGELSVGTLGTTCDVMKFSNKITALESAVRGLRPDVIITDELSLEDCCAVQKVVCAGISVIASAHFCKMEHVGNEFLRIFDRYVLLKGTVGEISNVFDKNGVECL